VLSQRETIPWNAKFLTSSIHSITIENDFQNQLARWFLYILATIKVGFNVISDIWLQKLQEGGYRLTESAPHSGGCDR
jgi:hypothetical protein